MTDYLVSAVIPSYNRPDRTQRAIDSVANQSYSPLELIVVDDGSSPPLEESINLPNTLKESRLLRHSENSGANVARNTGIDEANGEYLAFLDSDDEWKPSKIERQMAQLDSTGESNVCYTSVKQLDTNGKLNGISKATDEGDLSDALLRKNVIGTFSSVVVSRKVVDAAGKPDPQLPCYQDWEWYLRLSKKTKFTAISEPLTIRHNEANQISSDFEVKYKIAYPILLDRLETHSTSKQELKRATSGLQFRMGYAALVNQQYRSARSFFTKSIYSNPIFWKPYLFLLVSGRQFPLVRMLKRKFTRSVSER